MNVEKEDESNQASIGSLVAFTCQIVGTYLRHNTLPASEIPGLLKAVHIALQTCSSPKAGCDPATPTPAVPIRKSVRSDFIICLEDGRQLKMLKRYLRARYNMSPDEYRQRWGLGPDYPMVAPHYASQRSLLAKQHGLGRKSASPPGSPEKKRAPRSPSA